MTMSDAELDELERVLRRSPPHAGTHMQAADAIRDLRATLRTLAAPPSAEPTQSMAATPSNLACGPSQEGADGSAADLNSTAERPKSGVVGTRVADGSNTPQAKAGSIPAGGPARPGAERAGERG